MIEIDGVMRPTTYEEAKEIADAIQSKIDAAKKKISDAESELLQVCIQQYPVGSRVEVNVAARRRPTHEVIAVNENGYATLKNIHTGTERSMSLSSWMISPSRCWYSREILPIKSNISNTLRP